MFDSEMRLLELCSNNRHSVRELLRTLGGNRTNNMRLIKDFERAGVLESTPCPNGRGRPKRIVMTSLSGSEMLEKLRSANRAMLQINENDIRSIDEQLRAWHKLIDAGVDPYQRFVEMNEFDRSIRSSVASHTST